MSGVLAQIIIVKEKMYKNKNIMSRWVVIVLI